MKGFAGMQETEGVHEAETGRLTAQPLPERVAGGERPEAELSELDPADFEPREIRLPALRRTLTVLGLLLALGLAVVLPPLLNVNRFRRQIAGSISGSLGRPVHMDAVTLNLLPMPGFTLENFVVGEDPAFGAEPVIHANSVQARLRMRSLWRRRVEFSRISLTDTSVNLVHRADGRWNVESILLQAAKLDAAPTEQKAGGDAPRFPYIEAANARVNLKMGLEKMPLALTETEFALWLPQPQQWRLRLAGRPSRTDNAASDTGLLRVEGTLGKANALADVPVDLAAEWSGAPLGAVSWVLLGRDADFRGDMTLSAAAAGTLGRNLLSARLALRGARRAEFVPARTLDVDIACRARAADVFHRLEAVECAAPADARPPAVSLRGEVGDCLHPDSADLRAKVNGLDAGLLLDAVRLASPRVSPELRLTGRATGETTLAPREGSLTVTGARLTLGAAAPMLAGDVDAGWTGDHLSWGPVALELGGEATLEGHADRSGYTQHLVGTVLRPRLLALAAALPQFGDGLREALPVEAERPGAVEAPLRLDLISRRPWTGGQTWSAAARPAAGRRAGGKRRR